MRQRIQSSDLATKRDGSAIDKNQTAVVEYFAALQYKQADCALAVLDADQHENLRMRLIYHRVMERFFAACPWRFASQKEEARMSRIGFCLTATFLAAALSSAAIAQTSASPPATKPAPATSATEPSKASIPTQVETWTKDQWETAKKEWAKDTAKWASCQKQSRQQKLKGRKSWPFLYKCMTS